MPPHVSARALSPAPPRRRKRKLPPTPTARPAGRSLRLVWLPTLLRLPAGVHKYAAAPPPRTPHLLSIPPPILSPPFPSSRIAAGATR
uniref:Uncharacterized protein n=1 Tax=Setaria viridis TaxID=4556 RepID=A0A4U6WGC2_SETVI|nr:hypothetical protein SEVIR_1G301850v2 [Setaria viridis]